jgi:hypothetical protein
VTAVITSAGGEADADALTKLYADLEGKDIHELLAKGEVQLKSVVSSGGGGGGAAPAGNLLEFYHINGYYLCILEVIISIILKKLAFTYCVCT